MFKVVKNGSILVVGLSYAQAIDKILSNPAIVQKIGLGITFIDENNGDRYTILSV